MATGPRQTARSEGFATRYRVWRAGLGARAAEFAVPPEPRSIGSAAIGRQICEGQVLIGGRHVSLGGTSIWSVALPDGASEADRHGFVWLDDLAAAGTRKAIEVQTHWLRQWMDAYDTGKGPGWRADIAARRLVRWINHAASLGDPLEPAIKTRFRRGLTRHVQYLSGNWHSAPPGLPTFEALCGLIQGGLALKGMEPKVRPAIKALEHLCQSGIDATGGLPSRNPEDLLDLFVMLVWCETAMTEVGLTAQSEHRAAIARIAPTLRALRQADGALARFHGGSRGAEGRLDSALAGSRVRGTPRGSHAMGFARIARGRTTLILDAAPPPAGAHAVSGHASTLAFEMTVGRRPIIVNCGAGESFGDDWAMAARATPAHSTLAPDGASSARLNIDRQGRILLSDGPGAARSDPAPERGPASVTAMHDGFAASHGLMHVRRLDLGMDGVLLSGEDMLSAPSDAHRRRFEALDRDRGYHGIGFTIRFHLHPDVTADLGEDRNSVTLMLKSGELWHFRHASNARISLDPSVYLEKTRPQPTPTRQIVLEARAVEFTTAIRWSLQRAVSDRAPSRDLYRDDMSII